MKIELWEDVVCSFCGIADGRVAEALRRFGHEDDVEFVHRAFRLMPDFPEGESQPFAVHLEEQGYPLEQVQLMGAQVEQTALRDGIDPYFVLENRLGNTTLAHEFLAWAGELGKGNEAWALVLRKHFGEKAPLWTIDDLVVFAEPLGLNADDAREVLESGKYRKQVETDNIEAQALGATGVPFLVIDRKYGVVGAQSVEAFVNAFEQAWADRQVA